MIFLLTLYLVFIPERPAACGILLPWPGIEPSSSAATESWALEHQEIRCVAFLDKPPGITAMSKTPCEWSHYVRGSLEKKAHPLDPAQCPSGHRCPPGELVCSPFMGEPWGETAVQPQGVLGNTTWARKTSVWKLFHGEKGKWEAAEPLPSGVWRVITAENYRLRESKLSHQRIWKPQQWQSPV